MIPATKAKWTYYFIRIGIVVLLCLGGIAFRYWRDLPTRLEIIPDNSINIDIGKDQDAEKWRNLIDEKLKDYINQDETTLKNCSFDDPITKTESCAIDMSSFGPCNSDNYYGYKDGTPCIFFKLNRKMNWMPRRFSRFPDKFPRDLQYEAEHGDDQKVWISCMEFYPQGSSSGSGLIAFFPDHGYPFYLFPYMGQNDYLDPLVAVLFLNPAHNRDLDLKCTVWSEGFKDHLKFSLRVD